MKINIIIKKLLCIFLALAMISQSGFCAFAESEFTDLVRQNKTDFSAMDAAIEHIRSSNPYESALILETESQINKIQQSASSKKIAALKKTGQEEYGALWPAYVRAAGIKDLNILLTDLKTYLAGYYVGLQIMPFDLFEQQYKAEVEKAVKAAGKNKKTLAEVLKEYPAKSAYSAYKEQAREELAWRKANAGKVERAAYKVIREYLKVIPVQALDSESLSLLNDMVLNNTPVLTSAEKETAGKYHIAYLNRQELKGLDNGLFKDKRKQKTAKFTLSEITESILSGAVVSGNKAEYGKALQGLVYRSEETGVFSEILATGFGALVSAGQWSYAEGILSRYSKQELEGPAWYEYMDISHYSKAFQNRNGKYLGKMSSRTQYSSKYKYHNVFEDMARILSEEGSPNALYRYGSGRDDNNVIKPFKAGALLSKRSGLKEEAAAKAATIFANTEFGDITATEEYDLDKGLLNRYPAIRKDLTAKAVIDDASLAAKRNRQEVYGYLNRAAISGDMILAVWGAVGLYKMGVKGVGLTRSAYTTLKAARVAKREAKLAFLKANFITEKQYISARKIMLERLVIIEKSAVSAPKTTANATAVTKFKIADIKNIKQVVDNVREHAVWEAYDANGKFLCYIKYGNKRELARTIQFDKLVKSKKLAEKYDLLEIEYPQIITKNTSALAPELQASIDKELTYLRRVYNDRFYDANTPLVLSKVDSSGLVSTGLSAQDIKLLDGKPITENEWGQIVDFYKTLNENGFYHTDIFRNLHIRRLPDGKLKMTLLDFDFYPFSISDMHELSEIELNLMRLGLKERGFTTVYPQNLQPPRLPR